MASNNRKAPPRWPPKNAEDRNRLAASRPQTGGSSHAKRRIDNKKVQETLDDMFINIFDSEIIHSVAHSCGWKLNKTVEALIMLAEGSEFPDNKLGHKLGSSNFQSHAFSERESDEKSWIPPKTEPIKDSMKTDRTSEDTNGESVFTCSSSNVSIQSAKTKSVVMNASQGVIKVAYKGHDNLSDDDADVVIEEENEFEVSELDLAFSGASSQSLYQFLTPCVSTSQMCKDNWQSSLENKLKENNSSHSSVKVLPKQKQTVNDAFHNVRDQSPPKMSIKKAKHWPKFERIKKQINDGIKVMVLMRGCPGSGKTSLARHIIKSTYGEKEMKFIFSTDHYFTHIGNGKYTFERRLLPQAHQWNQQRVDEEVKKETNPIIIDNTNLEAWEMEPYVRMAVEFGYNVEFLEPRTSWRNNPFELERKNTHNVPRKNIEDMLARFEYDLTPLKFFSLFNLKYSLHNAPPQYVSQRRPLVINNSVTSGVKKKLKKKDEGNTAIKSIPAKNDPPKPILLTGVLGTDVADKEIKESLDVLISEWNQSVMAQSSEELNEAISEKVIFNHSGGIHTASNENTVSSIDKNFSESSTNFDSAGRNQVVNDLRMIGTDTVGYDEMDFVTDNTDVSEDEGEEMEFPSTAVKWDDGCEDDVNKTTAIPVLCTKTENFKNSKDAENQCMEYVIVLNDGTLLPQKAYCTENINGCPSKKGGREWEYLLMTDDSKLLFHPVVMKSSEEVCVEGDTKGNSDISKNNASTLFSKDLVNVDGHNSNFAVDNSAMQEIGGQNSLDSLLFTDESKENIKGDDFAKKIEFAGSKSETNSVIRFTESDLLIPEDAILLNIASTEVEDSPSRDFICNQLEIEIVNKDVMTASPSSPLSNSPEKGSDELTVEISEEAFFDHCSDEHTNVLPSCKNSSSSRDTNESELAKVGVSKENESVKLLDFELPKEELCLSLEQVGSVSEIKNETSADLISFISFDQEEQSIEEKMHCLKHSVAHVNEPREEDILETWEEGIGWDEQETTIPMHFTSIDSSTPKPARNIRRQGRMESNAEKPEGETKIIEVSDVINSELWSAVEDPITTWEETNETTDKEQEKSPERIGPQPQRKMFIVETGCETEEKSDVEVPRSSSGYGTLRNDELVFLQPVSLSDVLSCVDLETTDQTLSDSASTVKTGSDHMKSIKPISNSEHTIEHAGCSYSVDSIFEPKKNVLNSSTNTHHADFLTLGNVNMRCLDEAPGVKILRAQSRDIIESDHVIGGMKEVKRIGPVLMLDKSSMTYDIAFSPTEIENMKEQLINMFPRYRIEDLLEIFDKCNYDINWTVNLLLDSANQEIEISTQDSIHDNECDSAVLTEIDSFIPNSETTENACGMNSGSINSCSPFVDALSVSLNSTRASLTSPESCSKSTMQSKRNGKKDRSSISETSLLLKKQLEENIVINEEHYSEHVSRIRKLRHGEIVEVAGSFQDGSESFNVNSLQENIVNLSSNEYTLQQTSELDAASICALRPDAPEWESNDPNWNDVTAFEGHEEEETVFLKMDSTFSEQLHTLFGTASLPFKPDVKPTMNIPLSLARQLHSYLMEAEQNTYDLMMQEDEELARKLQLQDDRAIAEAATTFTNPVPDLREIMDMEMALALYQADKKQSNSVSKEDFATKLTKDLLCEWFPSLPKDVLMNVFEAHNNSFEDTLEVLLASTEEDNAVLVVMTAEARAAHEKALLKKANLESVKNKENVRPYPVEQEKVTSEQALEDADYYRSEATRHYSLRNECQQKAQKAYQRGLTAVASYYSQMALLHKERIEENNARAASSLLLAHSLGNLSTTLDLHFLYVVEALQVLDMFLDHHILHLLESNLRSVPVFVITGRGARSSGGKSRIKPAVEQRLEQRGLRHEEVNPGLLKVTITRNASSSAKMMVC